MTNMLIITAIHLMALGQVESGDNDHAIGLKGEVTRCQMLPSVWRATLREMDLLKVSMKPTRWADAKIVVSEIWCKRVLTFEQKEKRRPTNRELYLLWHCPARIDKPTKNDKDMAERFSNLVDKFSKKKGVK